jgi:hypothetical protein
MLRLLHGRFFVLLLCGLFLAGTGRVCAQRQNNFQQLNSQFSTGSATGVFLEPDQVMGTAMTSGDGSSANFVSRLPGSLTSQMNTGFAEELPGVNQRLSGSRATLPANTFDSKLSPYNGQMSNSPQWHNSFPMGHNFPVKMAPTPNTREPQMSSNMQRNSSLNDYTAYDRWKEHTPAPDKFTDAFTLHTSDNSKQLQQVGKELSLQDINRYQFQGSFSGEPGLPVTHAAGNSDQITTTGGGIRNNPKLFDYNASAISTVPSGGAVTPKVITSEGPRPYLPTGDGSTGTTTTKYPWSSSKQSSEAGSGQTSGAGSPSKDLPVRGEIQKIDGMAPEGKYQYTAPDGSKVPVELDAPEILIQQDK